MKFSSYLILGALFFTPPILANNLTINELMQSNIDCILDDFNEFPDSWVELYNGTDREIDLSSYSLGITNNATESCKLPAQNVKPGEFVIIYCDKQDEVQGLHMTFRLDSGKGSEVYLFKDNEVIENVYITKKQPAPNIAYGRLNENSDEWGYQATSTPGKVNCNRLIPIDNILGEPKFSVEGGIYNSPIELTFSLPKKAPSEAKIHYTLDGTEPTENSPVFENAIIIEKSTPVRAKLFCDGYLSPVSTTHSYLMPDHDITLPIVSIVSNPDYFYSDDLGILVTGSDSNNPNYEYDWRRPINIEYFPSTNETAAINQLSETRVKGGASRAVQLKSLILYANKRFGTKRFTYEFFPDNAPGKSEWKSIEIRNSGNDYHYAYMRDAVIQELMGTHTDLDWQPYQPSALMINGEYKGILNIRPRSNDDYIYTFYDGLEDIDMFENWLELKAGDWEEYNKFKNLYDNEAATAEEFREEMDIDEYFNLMIMNIYFANYDFPHNNIVMWRPRVENGKWRWIAKDTDFGLGLFCDAKFKMLDRYLNPAYYDWSRKLYAVKLFRTIMTIDELKDDFVNKFAVYMGDFLNATQTIDIVDKNYNKVKYEFPYHSRIINGSNFNYEEKINDLKKWAIEREEFFPEYLAKFFNLGSPVSMKINSNGCDLGNLSLNGISLKTSKFDGKHFVGSQIEVATDNSEFPAWEIQVDKNGETTTQTVNGNELTYTIPDCDAVRINMVQTTGIESVIDADSVSVDLNQPFEVYSLTGINYGTYPNYDSAKNSLSYGIYLIRQQSSTRRIIIR